jgi:hypothetical protein
MTSLAVAAWDAEADRILAKLLADDDERVRRAMARLGVELAPASTCEHCGGPLKRARTGRRKRFCSDRCRLRACRAAKAP